MLKKVLGYGVVGLLAVSLVAGTVYVLVRPAEAQAERGPVGGQGQGATGKRGGGNGRGQGAGGALTGEGTGLENPADTWITVSGTVIAFEDELSVETAEGVVEVGTGPVWFWDENGIALNAGDEVVLHGFYEGDEFELGAIENVTTGEALTLRDETGRPLWAGRGRWAN